MVAEQPVQLAKIRETEKPSRATWSCLCPASPAKTASVAGLIALLLLAPFAAGAGGVYKFVDDRGVVHFSNVPTDERYAPMPRQLRGLRMSIPTGSGAPVNHGYDTLIVRTALAHRLEPALVKAVIAAESNFSERAVSRAGAQGLMQLMPDTAEQLGVVDPFVAEENVVGGTRYLRKMLDRYGDLRRALAAYNAGPEAVDRHKGIPPYPETQAYVKRVMDYYRGYNDEFHR